MSTNILSHVDRLCSAGPRPMGSPAYHATADDIEQAFRAAGFAIHHTSFDAPAWQLRSARLSLQGEPLPAVANPFTVPCDAEGRIVVAGTSFAGIVKVDGWPASNHFEFVQHGVPCIPISSVCVGNVMHHPRDTRDWLSEAKLDEVASFVLQLIERLQDRAPALSRIESAK